MVFNFSLSQRRLIVNTPVNRTRAFVDVAALDKASKHSRGFSFVMIRHGEIRVIPLTKYPQPLEVTRLILESARRVFTTSSANAHRRHIRLLRAQLAVDIQLDRQSMTI